MKIVSINDKLFKIAISTILTITVYSGLGCLVFTGKYFQNWYNSQFSPPNHFVIFFIWICIFIFLGLTFYSLWNIDVKKNYLFLFFIQFFCFALNFIAMYRFMLTLLALISTILSLYFSVQLELLIMKNKLKKIAIIYAPYILWQIVWLLWCSLFWLVDYSLKNGQFSSSFLFALYKTNLSVK